MNHLHKHSHYRNMHTLLRYHYDNHPNKQNKSGVHFDHLKRIVDNVEVYPGGFAELLELQGKNIKAFKKKITQEKQRVDSDIAAFRIQIFNTLDDLRLSLHAQLDRVYQSYLEKYAKFKGQILQIHRLRDEVNIDYVGMMGHSNNSKTKERINSCSFRSNFQTLTQMQNDSKELKKYHVLNYIAEMQKQRIMPLNEMHRELILLTKYDNGYYQSQQFQRILDNLRESLNSQVRYIYDNNNQFIREIDTILFKEQPQFLSALDDKPNYSNRHTGQFHVYSKFPKTPTGSHLCGEVSAAGQSVKVGQVQELNIQQMNKINLQNSSVPLCGIQICNQLAFGLKDGTIKITSVEELNIATLKEHRASICCLSVIRIKGQNYLASGSDYGCSSIITWDPTTWQTIDRFNEHTAAVTCIIDLKDDVHILSAGYDKKINVYNLEKRSIMFTVPVNQTPVTGAVICKSGIRVVTCGLDKALSVWQVVKNAGKIQSLFLDRKIQNNYQICSIVASSFVNELVIIGTKDGKVKMINIEKGQSYKTINCSQSYLIELLMVERESKPYYPLLLTWLYKEKQLLIINSESGNIVNRSNSVEFEFGCGVGPKSFFLQRGSIMCCVNHNDRNKDITLYRIQSIPHKGP